jgi:site-specific DNA-cytosine methylase
MRAFELFAGSGALAYGFRQAGITFEMVIDADPNACASYEANLGQRPVQMDVRDLIRLLKAGWSPGPIDLLCADPPCAMWSRAGKREGLEDPRDTLEETVEVVRLTMPTAFLIGNIPGLQDSTHLPVVRATIGSLARKGYCIHFAEFDAVDFGVPQFRARPFWFGHRAGPCIVWPVPTHGNPKKLKQHGLPLAGVETRAPWVTCQEALAGLAPEDMGRVTHVKEPKARVVNEKLVAPPAPGQAGLGLEGTPQPEAGRVKARARIPQSARLGDPAAPAMTMTTKPARAGAGDSVVLALHPKHPISQPDAPSFAIGVGASGGGAQGGKVLALGDSRDGRAVRDQPLMGNRIGIAEAPSAAVTAKPSRVGAGAAVVLGWPWDRPSTAVTTDDRIAPPGHIDRLKVSAIFSQPNAIVLSEKAATRLQGLPDGWVFIGDTKRARWSQLGQALPPPRRQGDRAVDPGVLQGHAPGGAGPHPTPAREASGAASPRGGRGKPMSVEHLIAVLGAAVSILVTIVPMALLPDVDPPPPGPAPDDPLREAVSYRDNPRARRLSRWHRIRAWARRAWASRPWGGEGNATNTVAGHLVHFHAGHERTACDRALADVRAWRVGRTNFDIEGDDRCPACLAVLERRELHRPRRQMKLAALGLAALALVALTIWRWLW